MKTADLKNEIINQVKATKNELLLQEVYELLKFESEIPEWHKDIVRERLLSYSKNPSQGLDFDKTLDELEKSL